MFVRVKDSCTGHEFDVPEGDSRIGVGLELVKSDRYPPSIVPRKPKHFVATKPTPLTISKNDSQEEN